MTHKEYNGWYNYETWAVNLWIGNEEPSYRYWSNAARGEVEDAPLDSRVPKIWTKQEAARFNLADRLKEEIRDAAPDLGASLYADLLSGAFDEVNWTEIANALIEAATESA